MHFILLQWWYNN